MPTPNKEGTQSAGINGYTVQAARVLTNKHIPDRAHTGKQPRGEALQSEFQTASLKEETPLQPVFPCSLRLAFLSCLSPSLAPPLFSETQNLICDSGAEATWEEVEERT